MIIYQLHKYSGEFEYYEDHIIGSYLRKERAAEERAKAEANTKEMMRHSKKCQNCPFLEEDFSDIDDLLVEHSGYCPEAKLGEYAFGMTCENYYTIWSEPTFEVKEVEVEE